MTISQAAADALLEPHKPKLVEVMKGAFQRYKEMPANDRVDFDTVTRANVVNNFATKLAAQTFAGMSPAVTVHDDRKKQWFSLGFGGVLMMKINKRSARRLACSTNSTQQSLDFDSQQPVLDGFPDATNVHLLYGLDATGSEIIDLDVVCRKADVVAWSIALPLDQPASVLQHPRASAVEIEDLEKRPGIRSAEVVPLARTENDGSQ